MTGLILIFYTGTALVILFSFSEITKALFQFKLDVNTKYNNVAHCGTANIRIIGGDERGQLMSCSSF